MAKRDEEIALSELQADVMRVVWQRGEASTADVAEALAATRGLAHTTIATLLTRLEKRGALKSRRDGRQLVYTATVSEEAVRRSMVAGLVDSIFGGDANALVAHLVGKSEVAPGDLERIRRMLAKGSK